MPEIKERPILFSGSMVRAIRSGQKTVTRRAIKVQPHIDASGNFCAGRSNYGQDLDGKPVTKHFIKDCCPYGQPGDRLWGRKSFWQAGDWVTTYPEDDESHWSGSRRVHYRADGEPPNEPNHHYPNGLRNGSFSAADPHKIWRARPSIHMPRWACRILLEVTDVRVEQLQAISIGQICKERLAQSIYEFIPVTTAFDAFAEVWDSINGAGAWDANPWVWVVEFKQVTP